MDFISVISSTVTLTSVEELTGIYKSEITSQITLRSRMKSSTSWIVREEARCSRISVWIFILEF